MSSASNRIPHKHHIPAPKSPPHCANKTLSGAACSELFACSVGGKYVSTVHSPLSDFDPTAGAGARLHVWAEGNASKHRY